MYFLVIIKTFRYPSYSYKMFTCLKQHRAVMAAILCLRIVAILIQSKLWMV